jgi:RNA polymerase sigma-70 factor (TIGR02943 family)
MKASVISALARTLPLQGLAKLPFLRIPLKRTLLVSSHSLPPKSGDSVNPDSWVDDHGDCLYRYALIRVRTTEVARDLVQDTLLAALRNRGSYSGRASERTWLCGILKNKIVDYYRKLGRETSFTDLDSLSDAFSENFVDGGWIHAKAPNLWKPEIDLIAHRAEFWSTLRACLEKMPKKVANVFMLREMEDVEAKEICETLSIKDSNLWVMLHRARMALRDCLERNWFFKNQS